MFAYPRNSAFLWGHRGVPTQAIENTLESFSKAAQSNLPGFECDVQFSKDGVPFIFHDISLHRMSHVSGIAAECDISTLRKIPVRNQDHPEWGQATIPLLTEVLDELPPHMAINLELKGMFSWPKERAERFVADLSERKLIDRTIISSFHHDYFPVLAEVAPHVVLATLWKGPIPTLEQALQYRNAWGVHHLHWEWGYFTAQDVAMFQQHGFYIDVWGVHCEQDLAKAVLMNVNAMSIDDPTWGTAQVVLRLA